MGSGGWIKLHKQLLKWQWRSDPHTLSLFIILLLSVNFEDGYCMGKEVKRGQLFTTLKELSQTSGLTAKQTRTVLQKLESTGEITRKSNHNGTFITIENYDVYQSPDGERGANEGQTKSAKRGKPKSGERANQNTPEGANLNMPEGANQNADIATNQNQPTDVEIPTVTASNDSTSDKPKNVLEGKPKNTTSDKPKNVPEGKPKSPEGANEGQTKSAKRGKPTSYKEERSKELKKCENIIGNSIYNKAQKQKFDRDLHLTESGLDKEQVAIVREWLEYKEQRKEGYVDKGFEQLVGKFKKAFEKYGTDAIRDIIHESMANSWQGFFPERAKVKNGKQYRNTADVMSSSEIIAWANEQDERS